MRSIMLHDIKYSPLRYWTDATWYYTWSETHSCCLILPYIEIAKDDIRVQRPTNYAWLKLPTTLEGMAARTARGEVQHLEL